MTVIIICSRFFGYSLAVVYKNVMSKLAYTHSSNPMEELK